MKKFTTLSCASLLLATSVLTFSSFTTDKKPKKNAPVMAYSINLRDKIGVGEGEEWTWVLVNPNPGNGNNGTLQDVSHWDMALPPQAEAALVSAEYSRDGNTWHSISIDMDRDPSIRVCTSNDVLKFGIGSNGDEPLYFRTTFNKKFNVNAYATSYIKTGGGLQGCNLYYFAGVSGSERFD